MSSRFGPRALTVGLLLAAVLAAVLIPRLKPPPPPEPESEAAAPCLRYGSLECCLVDGR